MCEYDAYPRGTTYLYDIVRFLPCPQILNNTEKVLDSET
jgi:hypothetical protein